MPKLREVLSRIISGAILIVVGLGIALFIRNHLLNEMLKTASPGLVDAIDLYVIGMAFIAVLISYGILTLYQGWHLYDKH
ncbi:MAG: hypothetical protein U9M97_02160 [Candidatus Hadarchaeota archaeon]|nr:hypothetical protein [Candidatus Hadarchaeota archaeon]